MDYDKNIRKSLDAIRNVREEFTKMLNAPQGQLGNILADVSRKLNSTLETDALMNLIMKYVLDISHAERGFLMLFDGEQQRTEDLTFRIGMDDTGKPLESKEFRVSNSILDKVLETGEPLVINDMSQHMELAGQKSIMAFDLKSVLSVPLKGRKGVLGIIYVDSQSTRKEFTIEESELLLSLANQAAVSIENAFLNESLQKRNRNISMLNSISKVISSSIILDEVLNLVMDNVMELTNAERGFLMLRDNNGALEFVISRNISIKEYEGKDKQLSGTIINQVVDTCKSFHLADVTQDDFLKGQKSIMALDLKTVMCVPLLLGRHDISPSDSTVKEEKLIGLIYVDSTIINRTFNKDDLDILEAFAGHGAISIHNAKLFEDLKEQKRIQGIYDRYLSPSVMDSIVSTRKEIELGGTLQEVTVFFCDIRGFTTLSEKMAPAEVITLLNEYLSEMTDIIFRHDGTLDKYTGDGLMAVFGTPFPKEDDAVRAVRAGLEFMRRTEEMQQSRQKEGKGVLKLGVGINTGPAVVGNIGSKQRMDYTVIGDTVNLSARIESCSQNREVLIGPLTYERIKDHFEVKKLEPVTVKGKSQPVQIYQVLKEC